MQENKKSYKTKALKYFIVFLCVMFVMTFVSRGIYAYRLPVVKSTAIRNTTLEHNVKSEGTIQGSRELPVTVLPDLRILQVYVKKGDTVNEGDALMQLDKPFLEQYISELSASIETDKLTRNDYYTAEAWNSAKILTYSIEQKQAELQRYQQILENDAVVCSQISGMITDVKVIAGDLTTDAACFLVADLSQNLYFRSEISKDQHKYLFANDKVTLSFHNDDVTLSDCAISSIIESENPDMYYVQIPLSASDSSLTIGEYGILSYSVTTSERFECVSSGCVHQDGSINYVFVITQKESVLGMEYRVVRRNVDIIDKNDKYVAISGSGLNEEDKIVEYSSKDLTDGQIVKYSE